MKIAVLGVGLIGGSIGLAARRAGVRVCGYDSNPDASRAAFELGAIDEQASDIQTAVREAEIVFAATPVGVLTEVANQALEFAPADCVVSDVGSTKQVVMAVGADRRFIGGHPLAGSEAAGVSNARENLFEGAQWYLARVAHTTQAHYERLSDLLGRFGAQPMVIDPEAHDRLMAYISHMPHIVANLLVEQVATAGMHLPATGPSFRDATRVAGANSAIWTDIYLTNRDALITSIDEMGERLAAVRKLLEARDATAVTAWNDSVKAGREALLAAGPAETPLHELHVSVPNNEGVIADIALALRKAGVNIDEMAVNPSVNHVWGNVTLRVHGDEHARLTEKLISELHFPVARA